MEIRYNTEMPKRKSWRKEKRRKVRIALETF